VAPKPWTTDQRPRKCPRETSLGHFLVLLLFSPAQVCGEKLGNCRTVGRFRTPYLYESALRAYAPGANGAVLLSRAVRSSTHGRCEQLRKPERLAVRTVRDTKANVAERGLSSRSGHRI
jgi:hypothetical protein